MPRKIASPTALSSEEEMKKKMEDLQKQLDALLSKNNGQDASRINSDEDIPVMSLSVWPLTLTTKKYGRGDEYEFLRFGEVKNIVYSHLSGIIESNRSFVEAPCFYIMDNRVVKRHGLSDLYSKILDKEKIEKILACDSDTAVSLYKYAPKRQQDLIIETLTKNIFDGQNIDMNIVDLISRESGIDIMDRVKRSKQYSEEE